MAARSALSAKWQDLGVRTASALVLIPFVLVDIWAGNAWFALFAAMLGALVTREYVAIVFEGSPLQFACHMGAVLAGALLPGEAGIWAALATMGVFWLISLMATLFSTGGLRFWEAIGVAYVSLPAAGLVMLRADHDYGLMAIGFVFVAVWAADIMAYFAGRTIGGPKLWPRVSPNKTWAGLGGAVAGGMLCGAGLLAFDPTLPAVWVIGLGGVLALVEQGGDLLESALKRHYGVKDSGHLIPGHGGVMDRADGLMAAAVFAAALGWCLAGEAGIAGGLLLR